MHWQGTEEPSNRSRLEIFTKTPGGTPWNDAVNSSSVPNMDFISHSEVTTEGILNLLSTTDSISGTVFETNETDFQTVNINSTNDPCFNIGCVPIIVTNFVVAGLCAFANLVVMAAFIKCPRLRTQTNIIIFSLSVADLLVACVHFPFNTVGLHLIHIVPALEPMKYNVYFCFIRVSVGSFLTTTGNIHTVFIAVERYFKICQSQRYDSVLSKRKVILGCIAIYVFRLILVSLNWIWVVWSPGDDCKIETLLHPVVFRVSSYQILIALFISGGCYIAIFRHVHRMGKNMSKHSSTPRQSGETSRESQTKREIQLFKVIFRTECVYLLCYCPYPLMVWISGNNNNGATWLVTTTYICKKMFWLGCGLNPIVYGFLNNNYRAAIGSLFGRKMANGPM